MNNCPHCGMIHQTTCPRIKAIEYNQDGMTVKRVEFHAPLSEHGKGLMSCPLGQRIRELRDAHDISLRELARKLGCSAAFWSDVELGRRHASEAMLREAARILKISFDELKSFDTRPPLEEVKRATAENPDMARRRFRMPAIKTRARNRS